MSRTIQYLHRCPPQQLHMTSHICGGIKTVLEALILYYCWVNIARYSKFQTRLGAANRISMKYVVCDTVICHLINGIRVILDLNEFFTDWWNRRNISTCAYNPDTSTCAYRRGAYMRDNRVDRSLSKDAMFH